jgi:hypothetical protein
MTSTAHDIVLDAMRQFSAAPPSQWTQDAVHTILCSISALQPFARDLKMSGDTLLSLARSRDALTMLLPPLPAAQAALSRVVRSAVCLQEGPSCVFSSLMHALTIH